MSLAESILEDTFAVRRGPALLAGRARNALGVADGPPAEPRPARRADHLRAEGPPEERAGRVHPRRRAALPLPRGVRLDPRVPPAVARATTEGVHPRVDRRAGAHVDRASSPRSAPERWPAKGARAAPREGARGPAHAARVSGSTPTGTPGHAAAACGPGGARRRAPAARGHPGAVAEAPGGARRADRGDRGSGYIHPPHRAAGGAAAAARGAGPPPRACNRALESKGRA